MDILKIIKILALIVYVINLSQTIHRFNNNKYTAKETMHPAFWAIITSQIVFN